jgi:S-methylmethionine-dependent homocysteine/selenocysteine methylase
MTKVTILDGGMGRELERIGAPFSQPLWSAQALIESPQFVEQAHQRFIETGAEVLITNAYACVPFHLGENLFAAEGENLARQSAQIARKAVHASSQPVLVAGCLPPAMGSYRPDLFDAKRAFDIIGQLYTAQKDHVDLWIVETIACIEEYQTVHKVLEQTTLPCWYAFTLSDDVGQEPKLRSGEALSDALAEVIKGHAAGILFNCSIPEVMENAIAQTRTALKASDNKSIEIGAYANAFTPIQSDHQANDELQGMRSLSPEEYLEFAYRWKNAGATIIGGCCGIGPEHIKVLSHNLNND